jgi:hypothetical protein
MSVFDNRKTTEPNQAGLNQSCSSKVVEKRVVSKSLLGYLLRVLRH